MDRRNFLKTSGLASAGFLTSCKAVEKSKPYVLNNILEETKRKYSQKFNMCNYAAPRIDVVRIGFIGVGSRGSGAVERMSHIDKVKILGICDKADEKVQAILGKIKTSESPAIYSENEDSWMEMCQRDDIDLIYITTPWELHAPMAIYAMEQGKHVAVEIPLATTVEDCWKIVQTSEKTKKHCVLLENCCYDFFELLTLNLARNGFFGEIVHTEGAYIHELGEQLFLRAKTGKDWRLHENIKRNGNLYPTHGLGPVSQIMNINRGNRMDYLTSMQSNDFMMNDYAKLFSKDDDYFKQFIDSSFRGNMNATTIRTIKGQTILIQHDVTTPRPYSRIHLISGTKAFAQKYPTPGRISNSKNEEGEHVWMEQNEFDELEKKYAPPIVKEMGEIALKIGGHGGMDFLMDWRLIDCLRNGLPMDIDVYDGASWSVIGPLSEWSAANRSMPIDIPDFTNGKWETNQPFDISLSNGGTTKVNL